MDGLKVDNTRLRSSMRLSGYRLMPVRIIIQFLIALVFLTIQASQLALANESNWIAFEAKEGEQWQIFLVNINESEARRITDGNGENRSAAWSPDGNKLTFVSDKNGNKDIHIIEIPEGSLSHHSKLSSYSLTKNSGEDFSPTWSPDGTRISFVSDRDGNQEIYVMSLKGMIPVRLTANDSRDYSPNWSPDGTKLAFVSRRDGNYEIYSMGIDGADQQNLTRHSAEDGRGDHSWSPDGKKIAWITDRDMDGNANWEIYAMNANGSQATNLTKTPTEERMSNAIWSPQGERIAFVSYRDGNGEVYVMNEDGTHPINLSRHPAVDRDPIWSADGNHIAFVSRREGTDEIYIISSDGTGLKRVASSTGEIGKLEWRPKGQ